ncbi:histidine kinase [Halarcobacter ebronensis]|uniref:histidine kinase n=1 Tax=Halarcobacter ebronensis TaxID=1462615 RepID=A0A4Q0YFD3_9BACT|nr:sensor histidine kinase [Halarcobacter ebronensis]RXJ68913.1 histidine kinase [Halarcobacter ebronensis]
MKPLFFILFFISSLYSSNLYKKLVSALYISEDFKTYKLLTKYNYKEYDNVKLKEFSIKMVLKKDELKNETYYMSIISDFDSLIYTNVEYKRVNNIAIIKLDKNTPNTIFFNYNYEKPKRGEFRFTPLNQFEYRYILPYEGILYGVAYGIIFCAFLYYLVIFFSTKRRCFLYYSLMQFCVLGSLIGFTYLSFRAYVTNFEQGLIDFFETSAFLLTLLFAKEVLETKKLMPKMDKLLNFFIYLNVVDLFAITIFKYSILYEYMSFSVGFIIPSIAGLIAVYKGNKQAVFYTFGWLIMSFFLFILQNYMFPFSSIYGIHIATPLESLIFSFALGLMLRDLVDEQNEKEKLLIHKSKLISMGEMINNIAHQWRQPLTHLGYINMNLQLALEDEKIDRMFVKDKICESNEQIDFMSNTINSFRDFYKPEKEKELFYISQAVQNSIDIMKPLLDIYDIKLEFIVIKDKKVRSYKNEYSQVILNLITNAKDELILKSITNPTIVIRVDLVENKSITTVCDNAGGINSKIIDKIFEPYFSTKDAGSGIGLYMSKTIISSHFKGELTVENKKLGACFSVIF